MIAWLKGRCHVLAADHVVVDVHGVGYHVFLPGTDASGLQAGEEIELQIHTVVREESFSLYGFRTLAAREMFRTILSISGVGPKGALALLSSLQPGEIARAIHDDQPKVLTVAKGIGKRTAELIVVRLRERLPTDLLSGAMAHAVVPIDAYSKAMRDAKSALVNLGFRAALADKAVRDAAATTGDGTDCSDDFDHLLRSALSMLRRPQS
jgi:holliday junction DNA helicase RuvA